MTIAEALELAQKHLADKANSQGEAFSLLESLLGKSKPELVLSRSSLLTSAQVKTLNNWLERRTAGEPLQHILAKAPFYGLELMVSPEVLIPRPETEVLVDRALQQLRKLAKPRVLDVGTGSGAIALAIKQECPSAEVWASDLSADALKIARENAKCLHLEVTFIHADLLTEPELADYARTVDVLLANLPYLPASDKAWLSSEVQHDPELALFSGEDGLELFYNLEKQAFSLLKKGSAGFFELDPRNVWQAYEACAHWSAREVFQDLVLRDRFLRLVR